MKFTSSLLNLASITLLAFTATVATQLATKANQAPQTVHTQKLQLSPGKINSLLNEQTNDFILLTPDVKYAPSHVVRNANAASIEATPEFILLTPDVKYIPPQIDNNLAQPSQLRRN